MEAANPRASTLTARSVTVQKAVIAEGIGYWGQGTSKDTSPVFSVPCTLSPVPSSVFSVFSPFAIRHLVL